MKDDIDIPIPKKEDNVALNNRRESYALARDLQASEFNDAIAKRLLAEAMNKVKCKKCGKEFSTETTPEEEPLCPDCKKANT